MARWLHRHGGGLWRVAMLAPIVAVAVILLGSLSDSAATPPRAGLLRSRVASSAPGAGAVHQPTRYSLVHGCYTMQSPATGAAIAAAEGPFRMQAAALGVYLLYERGGDYLIGDPDGSFDSAASPSAAAEWNVDGTAAGGFTMTNAATGTSDAVTFVPASGCATYPEADTDATGSSFTGTAPEGDVLGTVEGHAHITAYEFLGGDWHCGRPWSPFGAPYALPASCGPDETGTNGLVESFVDFGGLSRPRGMRGWPTFVGWPSPTALAEEGDYYTGIERAWKAGLRLMVTDLVDNEALCTLMTAKRNPCNDMDAVRLQSHDLYALQDYIDAQSGGPGKGWFRIVTDPFQARQVISEGKLAVIEGVEVSRIFGCGEVGGKPQCDPSQIDAGLKEVHDLGVRTFFPVHEFNNAFGGTKMIAGDLGTLINAGNRLETGSFWNLQPCSSQTQDAEQLTAPAAGALASLLNGPVATLLHGTPLPVYAPGPQCNTQGLTDLGSYLINAMIKDHFLIQLDHMDSKTATAALAIATAHHYSGVISAHCCSSPQLFGQIYADGGFISPPVQPAAAFVATERTDKALADPRYHFGFGYGSDMNGLADQPGPSSATPITYPFTSYKGDVTFDREQWGERTFDLNTDGLANYGMYADWLNEVQKLGGPSVMNDMFQGAEAYLETWERADGVPATRCMPAHQRLTGRGLGSKLRLGQTAEGALYSAGQPSARPGRSYRYCVRGGHGVVHAVFDGRGRIGLIAGTARSDRAGRLHPGSRIRGRDHRLVHGLHRIASRLWVGGAIAHGARYLYGVRGGRVRFVAIVSRSELSSARRLRADLRAASL